MIELPPEISLAQAIVEEEKYKPGDSLDKLVKKFASIEYLSFPFGDGISYDLKTNNPAKILINSDNNSSRQKFTLAHEFGHVMIPWHVGTILSSIDTNIHSSYLYREMEAEANRFASGILMPTYWINELSDSLKTPDRILSKILDVTKVSTQAAIIKLMQSLDRGYICLEYYSGRFNQRYSSPNTITSLPLADELPNLNILKRLTDSSWSLKLGSYEYMWFYINQAPTIPLLTTLNKTWRDLLNEILDTIPVDNQKHIQQSLNALIANAFHKNNDAEKAYQHVISRVKGYEYASSIFNHPEFTNFILLKLNDLLNKKTNKT